MFMDTLRTRFLVLAVTAVGLAAACPAQAEVTGHKINAKGEGALTGPTTTESQIIGGGILHGTTTSELVFTGVDPTTGDLTYEGVLVLTTEHGTLTLAILDGLFNPVTGEFSNDSTVTDGTGRFAGATRSCSSTASSPPMGPSPTMPSSGRSGWICRRASSRVPSVRHATKSGAGVDAATRPMTRRDRGVNPPPKIRRRVVAEVGRITFRLGTADWPGD